MKIVDTLQRYVKFGYKTFVVNNYVLEDPAEVDEVLKDEYVYKNGKLFKALKNTVSKTENLSDNNIFIEISAYLDETPKSKESKAPEITKNVQSVEQTEDEKTEDKKVEKLEENQQILNKIKTKKRR